LRGGKGLTGLTDVDWRENTCLTGGIAHLAYVDWRENTSLRGGKVLLTDVLHGVEVEYI